MLQQTQVVTAVGYFEKFTRRFPKVEDLANASLDEVLGLWSGLGYYSRARNLHRAAQLVAEERSGSFPKTEDDLRSLPGVGPYTAGAIATLAYDAPSHMVDGNIARVFTRLAEEATPIDSAAGKKWLEKNSYAFLSAHEHPRVVGEGLMELGATVCHPKNPQCDVCPFAPSCRARKNQSVGQFPVKKSKTKVKLVRQIALLIRTPKSVLLQKQPEEGLFGGLYALPVREIERVPNRRDAQKWLSELGLGEHNVGEWRSEPVIRRLSHRTLHIYCATVSLPRQRKLPGEWHLLKNLGDLGISTAAAATLCAASPSLSQFFGERGTKL